MAEKKTNQNDLSSDDVEIDGEGFAIITGHRFPGMSPHITTTKGALQSKTHNPAVKTAEQLDSGVLSMSLELKTPSSEPTIPFVDKTPVQCSDAYENDSVDIERKFGQLCVTDDVDDEGHVSMQSLRSIDSVSSEHAVQRSIDCVSSEHAVLESQDIEVDLYQQDDDGDTIIHVAIVSLMPDSAVVLIEIAEDDKCLNIQNYLLQSPLHLAVLTGQVEIVKSLVTKGADVTLRDQQGNTPLHIACRKGDRDAVSTIVQSFGDDTKKRTKYFSMKNCEGLTCLHVAAQQKEFIILGHLFAKGADVNIGDSKSGRTMLHYAVERKDVETVTLLLTHPSIDVDCKTFKGETPLVLAYWRNYQDIVKRLKTKGAFFSYDIVDDSDDENTS